MEYTLGTDCTIGRFTDERPVCGVVRYPMKPMMTATIALLAVFLCGGCATTRRNTAEDQRPARLQITVGVPPSMSVLRSEEIAEAFGYRVAAYLHEQGFRGRIRYVDPWETPNAERPVLAVELREWRVDRSGFVDCTFTAELASAGSRRNLGVFHGTSIMTWPRRDWYARAEGFEEAARDAITNLATRLEQTGMLDRPAE
jgi:hypothetical protein